MYNMLTMSAPAAGNQYLNPDLQPLSPSMDMKNSPLAMLVQTCNNIGKAADGSSLHSILPPLEKRDDHHKDINDNQLDSMLRKSPKNTPSTSPSRFKMSPDNQRMSHPSGDNRKSQSPIITPGRAGHPLSSTRSPIRPSVIEVTQKSPAGEGSKRTSRPPSPRARSVHSSDARPLSGYRSSPCSRSPPRPRSPEFRQEREHGLSPKGLVPPPAHQGIPATYPGIPAAHQSHLSGPYHMDAVHNSYLRYLEASGLAPSAKMAAEAAVAAAYGNSLYSHPAAAAAALRLPIGHHSSGSPSSAVCKDPGCTQCLLALRSGQLGHAGHGTCGPTCSQCPGLPVPVSSAAAFHGLPLPGYPYTSMAAAAHQQALPFVCSWFAGHDPCGKRFSTSEELFQHLKSHTGVPSMPSVPTAAELSGHYANPLMSGLSLPTSAAGMVNANSLLAYHAMLASSPRSLSPASVMKQAYERSVSPTSLLAARYHPYKVTQPGAPGVPSPFLGVPMPVPGHYPYFSAGAVPGQRLGPLTVVP